MKVLAVVEQRDGALRKVSHEILAAARVLADTSGGAVDAIVFGAGAVSGMEQLGGFGADRVLHATHADFALYAPDGASATIASIGAGYGAIVFAATAMGRDLAPARRGATWCRVCHGHHGPGGRGRCRHGHPPDLRRQGAAARKAHRHDGSGLGAAEHLPSGGKRQGGLRYRRWRCRRSPRASPRRASRSPTPPMLDVTEASVVISGGRGLKEPVNFKLLEDLAAAFGERGGGCEPRGGRRGLARSR